jgi:hypothetical protein
MDERASRDASGRPSLSVESLLLFLKENGVSRSWLVQSTQEQRNSLGKFPTRLVHLESSHKLIHGVLIIS